LNAANIFDAIPSVLNEELFESIVATDTVKIERIVSKGHTTPIGRWYNQDRHEWVIVLKGSATIECEHEKPLHLKEGGYLNIPAGTKHKVTWTDPEIETLWLAVHY
jgi:cupin 2 domain-containing protein